LNGICDIYLCLFISAMVLHLRKHVWLPDSMEGPTPISALIQPHDVVTARHFHGEARMSPLFELSKQP
jgi:NADH:ubiquinone oxidoreductase subunit 5 (subunit L)/multisubunit Na+/H+ antiporter MnhA subunit